MSRLKVYIADDHALFRQAFVRILKENRSVGEVREAGDGKELLSFIEKDVPNIVIIDIEMPGMDGIQVCKKIAAGYPEIKTMVISMHEEKLTIGKVLKYGALAYLPKAADVTEFELAFESIVSGKAYMNSLMKEALQHIQLLGIENDVLRPVRDISVKQKAIIELICRQFTNRQIAIELSLSEHTVRNHKVRLMKKLKVKNAQGLVKFAVENGLSPIS